MGKLFISGLSIGATDEITVSANTKSIDITNLSHFDLQIDGVNFGSKILPAYATKPYTVPPGERLGFTLNQSTLNPASQANEYIQVVESSFEYESGITPLALIPVYTTEVNITNGNVPVSGTVDATIQNASIPVTGSVNATIQNATLPISGNVGISSGTVDANITNATVNVKGSTPSESTVFSDSLTNGSNWTTESGSVSYGSNGATFTTSASLIVAGNGSWSPQKGDSGEDLPVTIQSNLKTPSSGVPLNMKASLWKDVNNSYELRWQNDNNLVLYKTVAGVTNALVSNNSVSQTASTTYEMKLSITSANVITAQLLDSNGNVLVALPTQTDTSITGNFNIGIGGDNGVIATGANVSAPKNGMPVFGSVNITNATLPISGNVSISSGAVNATIENAEIPSNIVNVAVPTNPLIKLAESQVFTLTNGASVTNLISLQVQQGVYDTFFFVTELDSSTDTFDGLLPKLYAYKSSIDGVVNLKTSPLPLPLTSLSVDTSEAGKRNEFSTVTVSSPTLLDTLTIGFGANQATNNQTLKISIYATSNNEVTISDNQTINPAKIATDSSKIIAAGSSYSLVIPGTVNSVFSAISAVIETAGNTIGIVPYIQEVNDVTTEQYYPPFDIGQSKNIIIRKTNLRFNGVTGARIGFYNNSGSSVTVNQATIWGWKDTETQPKPIVQIIEQAVGLNATINPNVTGATFGGNIDASEYIAISFELTLASGQSASNLTPCFYEVDSNGQGDTITMNKSTNGGATLYGEKTNRRLSKTILPFINNTSASTLTLIGYTVYGWRS